MVAVAALASSSSAQTLLFAEGDQVPGEPYVARNTLELSAHPSGAWCVLVDIEGQTGYYGRPFVVGSQSDRGAAEVLARPGLRGGRTILGYTRFVPLPDDVYFAAGFLAAGGVPSEGIFQGDELKLKTFGAIPGTGDLWSDFGTFAVSSEGQVTLKAFRLTPTGTSGFINGGLEFDPLLETGGILSPPGIPLTSVGFTDDGLTASGDHWGANAIVDRGPGIGLTRGLLVNGELLEIDGVPIFRGDPAPPSISATGTWDQIDPFVAPQVSANGTVAFAQGMVSYAPGVPTFSGIAVRNGAVVFDPLNTVGGTQVRDVESISLNSFGEYVSVARLQPTSVYAIVYEGREVARTGDTVDVDGDGVLDPGHELGFISSDDLVLTDAGDIYYLARVISPTDDRLGVIRQSIALPSERFCDATDNSTGVTGTVRALGSRAVADHDLTIATAGLPRDQFGFLLCSRDTDFVPMAGGSDGNLCLGGTIGRFVAPGQIQSSGRAGRIEVDVDVNALPQGGATVAAAPGETWNFQLWHRDTSSGGSNFSAALAVEFE